MVDLDGKLTKAEGAGTEALVAQLGRNVAEEVDLGFFRIDETFLEDPSQHGVPEGNELLGRFGRSQV